MILLDQSLSETYKDDSKIRKNKFYNYHVVIIDILILIILGSS